MLKHTHLHTHVLPSLPPSLLSCFPPFLPPYHQSSRTSRRCLSRPPPSAPAVLRVPWAPEHRKRFSAVGLEGGRSRGGTRPALRGCWCSSHSRRESSGRRPRSPPRPSRKPGRRQALRRGGSVGEGGGREGQLGLVVGCLEGRGEEKETIYTYLYIHV